MKKIISITLVLLVLVSAGTAAFAQEDTQEIDSPRTIETLFDKYNPTAKQEFLTLQEEHREFHEERSVIRLEIIQNYSGQVSSITGQVADGTITPAEGREQLQALRAGVKSIREAIAAVLEPKKAEIEAIKNQAEAVRDSIKDALKEDEVSESQIAGYLDQLVDLLNQHLEIDFKYAALVDEVIG